MVDNILSDRNLRVGGGVVLLAKPVLTLTQGAAFPSAFDRGTLFDFWIPIAGGVSALFPYQGSKMVAGGSMLGVGINNWLIGKRSASFENILYTYGMIGAGVGLLFI